VSYQGRSHGEQQLVEQLLTHLQREADDERLRDLASDVLGGRLTLQEAMASSVYTEAVAPAMNEYNERYMAMDQKGRDTEAQRAAAIVRKLEEADQDQ
jgi:hypothetical protein